MVSLYVQSVNHTIGLQTSRVVAVRAARLPAALWSLIYVVAVLATVLVGLSNGTSGRRHVVALLLLVLIFSSVVSLIADLERPQQGALQVRQQPLLDLQRQIRAWGS